MTDSENKLNRFLDGTAARACDLIERECAVEEGRDHHVALMLLAAGTALLVGLCHHPATPAATRLVLPGLCERVEAELVRRKNERDTSRH